MGTFIKCTKTSRFTSYGRKCLEKTPSLDNVVPLRKKLIWHWSIHLIQSEVVITSFYVISRWQWLQVTTLMMLLITKCIILQFVGSN